MAYVSASPVFGSSLYHTSIKKQLKYYHLYDFIFGDLHLNGSEDQIYR